MHPYRCFLISKGDDLFVIYKKIPYPVIDGEYLKIYTPQGDTYRGPDTKSFENGKFYSEWLANDFSIMNDRNEWHMIGISHPKPLDFKGAYDSGADVHEAEYQLFHAKAEGKSFSEIFRENSFSDCEKVLYPSERADEKPEIWAPHIMKLDGKNALFYSPGVMRLAQSESFENWERRVLFSGSNPMSRDPYVYTEDGVHYFVYTDGLSLKFRTTVDFKDFSDEKLLLSDKFGGAQLESPYLLKKDGIYYLFVSVWDGNNGDYDERTFVYASETIEGLDTGAPITMLRAHAPEIVKDTDGTYYILSVFYPHNGVSAAKLLWK
jgi:hypothetical protein